MGNQDCMLSKRNPLTLHCDVVGSASPVVEQGEDELQVGVAEGGVQAHQLAQRQQRGRAQSGAGVPQAPAQAQRITGHVRMHAPAVASVRPVQAHHVHPTLS